MVDAWKTAAGKKEKKYQFEYSMERKTKSHFSYFLYENSTGNMQTTNKYKRKMGIEEKTEQTNYICV